MLEHGGRLRAAAQDYGIPLANWLDLSTGINPEAYPVPPLALECWNRLPEEGDGLEDAAARYYGNSRLLALPGSQAAIQGLPGLFKPAVVACVTPIYEEHTQAWERAGHRLRRLPNLSRALAAATPIVLLCNPNNPTVAKLSRDEVLAAAGQLQKRGGWLIVDEAFGDSVPENTVTDRAGSDAAPNLIVLRSLGKFFGLAGARVGFVFGDAEKLALLREKLGPWALSHPARVVARAALADSAWQTATRRQLAIRSQRLAELLAPFGEVTSTALFSTVTVPNVMTIFEHFARRGILIRRFDQYGLLRFGLPGDEAQWQRLSSALAEIPELEIGAASCVLS